MYELPTHGNVKRVVVDDACIDGKSKPLLVYGDEADKQVKNESVTKNIQDAAA